jgi:hypothetical protein
MADSDISVSLHLVILSNLWVISLFYFFLVSIVTVMERNGRIKVSKSFLDTYAGRQVS